jgi:hypothetical protein
MASVFLPARRVRERTALQPDEKRFDAVWFGFGVPPVRVGRPGTGGTDGPG